VASAADVAILLSLVGIVLLLGSVASFQATRRFLRAAARTDATVTQIAVDEYTSPDGELYYYAVVEFRDAMGRRVELRWPSGTLPPPYRVGQHLSIVYDRENPHRAAINSIPSIWFGFLALLGLGVALTGGGFALFAAGSP
jgi:hypothetical protein